MRKNGGGDRANAARCARDQDLALVGRQAMIFERHDAQDGGKACRANRHGIACAKARREWHQPIGIEPCLGGITAPMGLAHPPAGQDNRVTNLVAVIAGLADRASKINTRNMRIIAHQTALTAHA